MGNLIQDSKENILYGYVYNFNATAVPHIRKINGYNFDAPMWDKEYNTANHPNLMKLHRLLMDPQDNLYLVSGADDVDIFKVDSNNGNQIWGLNSVNSSVHGANVSYHKFYDGHLYVSLKHNTVGAITSYFAVKKINTETGTMVWNGPSPQMSIAPLGPNLPDNQAILSFDIGCDGSIYATGYCGSNGFGDGAWGIMKISGTTGAKLAEKIIDNNLQLDGLSNGYAAYAFNDEPLFIGNKQNGSVVGRAIVKTDTDLISNGSMSSPCSVLSTEELAKASIEIYPNPTTDRVNILLEDNTTIASILVYAIDGRKMGAWEGSQDHISIGSFPTGVYVMKIIDNDNKVFYKKIIKK
ncbi:MAG: T9SS type A sorting domain-containing protein [Chitinophagaceae bacterium]|nr:MAG: T9SS type A sorting domain-containing protein [Chitinophagaceae bacterium]